MENATEYRDARECGHARQCLDAARSGMRQVKKLLSRPSLDAADESAALLRDVEVQLGCVAAILRQSGAKPDVEIRAGVEELQSEVAVLAAFFAGADKMISPLAGWHSLAPGGNTERGHAAPLVLVKKLSVEG